MKAAKNVRMALPALLLGAIGAFGPLGLQAQGAPRSGQGEIKAGLAAASQQAPPPSRVLNILVSSMVCGGNKMACGNVYKLWPATGDPETERCFVRFFPLPDGKCDRKKGTKKEVKDWVDANCLQGLGCFECILD